MDPEPILTTPATEEMNTILPIPDAFRRGCASWHRWYIDSKLVVMSVEKSSEVNSMVGFLMFVPTLFIYTQKITDSKS